MTWNHRVMRRVDGVDVEFEIHEIHYDTLGNPTGWTENPVSVSAESIDGLRWQLSQMILSLDEPVLEYGEALVDRVVTADTFEQVAACTSSFRGVLNGLMEAERRLLDIIDGIDSRMANVRAAKEAPDA